MNHRGTLRDIWSLPLTGTIGFLMVHYAAKMLDKRHNRLRDILVFIGDNTLYVLVFHILAYKAVSLLKIWHYGLEWEQIGCHMVIHDFRDDGYWILYSIAGVALPLLGLILVRSLRRRFSTQLTDTGNSMTTKPSIAFRSPKSTQKAPDALLHTQNNIN